MRTIFMFNQIHRPASVIAKAPIALLLRNRQGLARIYSIVLCSFLFVETSTGQGIADAVGQVGTFGLNQTAAKKVNDAIYHATGFGNTFMVLTNDGNVVIDTGMSGMATKHHRLLQAVSNAPVKYVIVTHAHPDHTGGVALWKGPNTKYIAQRNSDEFEKYQDMLAGLFARRNAAQFAIPPAFVANYIKSRANRIKPEITFGEQFQFALGDTDFIIFHTPGETDDHATIWIPKYKAAFVGDNIYDSFPNMYTLRGTKPRWALDYINSINKVLSLKPEIVLPSHGDPIVDSERIIKKLTRYRDAIQYVHDATVKGMNDGKDVFTLMNEIKLPSELDVGQGYGKIAWSVRGIYEGYVGWFDEKPESMYEVPASSIHRDLVELAGGGDKILARARELKSAGKLVEALHLSSVALASETDRRAALVERLEILRAIAAKSKNLNERGWLQHFVTQTKSEVDKLAANEKGK